MGEDRPNRVGRRGFLRGAAIAGAGAAVPVGLGPFTPASATDSAPFAGAAACDPRAWPLGVASGDPRPDSVVLWTRVDPEVAGGGALTVHWQVATDANFTAVVAAGQVEANTDHDHTVKVRPTGLPSATTLYYRFAAAGLLGPIGRTHTAPAADSVPESFRVAFCSCQSWESGYYWAYRHMLDEDVDLVLHLGDYIYETPFHSVRIMRTDPLVVPGTLEQYRAKYRLYRSDVWLQAAHASYPFATIWDDHEVANDHDRTFPKEQFDAAHQAWFDYQPVWPEGGEDDPFRIYRALRWGKLADVFCCDERQYRDPVPGALGGDNSYRATSSFMNTATYPGSQTNDPSRSMLGATQHQWLLDGLDASDATWKIIGNEVMFAPLRLLDFDTAQLRKLMPNLPHNAGIYFGGDQWDGYNAERHAICDHIRSHGLDGVVFLTGDIHEYFAAEVPDDIDVASSPSVAVEFVGGSITTPALGDVTDQLAPDIERSLQRQNPHIRYVNMVDHGYGIAEFTAAALDVKFQAADQHAFEPPLRTLASFHVDHGDNTIHRL